MHSPYLPAELDGRGAHGEDGGELEDVTGRQGAHGLPQLLREILILQRKGNRWAEWAGGRKPVGVFRPHQERVGHVGQEVVESVSRSRDTVGHCHPSGGPSYPRLHGPPWELYLQHTLLRES